MFSKLLSHLQPLPPLNPETEESRGLATYLRPFGITRQEQTARVYIKSPSLGFHWFICFSIEPHWKRLVSFLDQVIDAHHECYVFTKLKP